MAAKKKAPGKKIVETLRHEDATRKNIPTAELQPVLQKKEQDPLRVAYERRNRDLDPQLVWRGKDTQDWSDLDPMECPRRADHGGASDRRNGTDRI